ncbi:MAG: hypothetical protein QOC65_75 [Sphingomonadales bacterium]|nr:hypothetical protein [Sphingomonadales bacterium]
MKANLLSGGLFAVLLGCATAPDRPAAPDDVVELYVRATAYGASGAARLCADPALRPRYQAAAARLAAASRMLSARYADPRLDRRQPPPFADRGTLCTNAVAAADAVTGFETSVARLEARLD